MQYVDGSSAQCTLARRNTTLAIQMEAAFSIYILLQNQQKNIYKFSLVNSRKKRYSKWNEPLHDNPVKSVSTYKSTTQTFMALYSL